MLDSAYIDTLVKKAAEFGNGKIHVIVNNAGFTWDGVIHKVRLQSASQHADHRLRTGAMSADAGMVDYR